MTRAYEELVDFIAGGASSASVARFEASPATKGRVADLIHREKTTGLSRDEHAELDYYLQMEHVLRLAKARARSKASDDELRLD
jgi:hypothetical protein